MQNPNRLNHIVLSLIDYWRLWVVPCLLGLCLSVVYVLLFYSPTFTARQSLILRDDLMGDSFKPSRFESLDSMKSAQETILEIARKPEVIRNVVEQIGERQTSFLGSGEVTDQDIEEMQENIEFGAPNGAEFGRTEAVVLRVTADSRENAKIFTDLLLNEIDAKLSDVRRERLNSMEQELTVASQSALESLQNSSKQLQELESGFGTEIITIRELNDPQGGNSFDQKLNQIRQERREAVSALVSAGEQRILLENALANDSLVTSNQLLEMQPSLAVMMGSLNTAREQLSIDEGRYKPLHPALRASREAVKHQKKLLFNSLRPTLVGVESQIGMAESRVKRLDASIAKLENKLMELTKQRVPYATLQEDVLSKTKAYSDVEAKLSQVKSYTSSTQNFGLLTRVGEPQVGSRPNGLGRTTLLLVGLIGGLLIGLGLVALVVPSPNTTFEHPPLDTLAGRDQQDLRDNNPVETISQYAAPQPASATKAPTPTQTPSLNTGSSDTVSESRLKSVAHQEQTRKQSKVDNQAKSGSAAGLKSTPAGSAIPDSVAMHLADLKNKTKAVLTPSSSSTEHAPKEQPHTGSQQVAPDIETPRSKAKSDDPTSQSMESVQQQLRELDAAQAKMKDVKKTMVINSSSETDTAGERRKTLAPEVPDSVAAGRITAESLIQSTARRVQGQSEKKDSSLGAVQQTTGLANKPVDSSILQKVKAQLESQVGESLKPGPSNSDLTRSVEGELTTKRGPDELQDPSNSPLPLERRPSNVRPVDIAKSLDSLENTRGSVDNIRPDDSDSNSTQLGNQRSVEATVSSKGIDNSLVGLMRETSRSDVVLATRKSETDVSIEDLKPASKTPEKPPATTEATSKARANEASEPIPEQIKQLSDSISSFARPTGKKTDPKK